MNTMKFACLADRNSFSSPVLNGITPELQDNIMQCYMILKIDCTDKMISLYRRGMTTPQLPKNISLWSKLGIFSSSTGCSKRKLFRFWQMSINYKSCTEPLDMILWGTVAILQPKKVEWNQQKLRCPKFSIVKKSRPNGWTRMI